MVTTAPTAHVPAGIPIPASSRDARGRDQTVSVGVTAVLLALTIIALLVTAWAYVRGAWGYVDNGDGYYLYAARRVARGAVLYRQVMGTQPPVVYLLGAAAFKLGATLPALRLLSAALRALTAGLVYAVGVRLYADRRVAALAALVYAVLPIGLLWGRSFDVNPPLTLVALLSALALSRLTPRGSRVGGLLGAAALFTKTLYLPLLVVTLVYLCRESSRRRLLGPYLQGLLAGCVTFTLALAAYAGPASPRDAFLGQGASPLNPSWFAGSLLYVGVMEGGVVLVAIAGAIVCRRAAHLLPFTASPARKERVAGAAISYAPWLLAGGMAVLVATLKEGTFGTVFCCAEPAVALLAAYGMAQALRLRSPAPSADAQTLPQRQRGAWRRGAARIAARTMLPIAALSLLACLGVDRAGLRGADAGEVARVSALTRAYARPGATIVAPPYYALLTDTRVPDDAGDTYILAQRVRRGEASALSWVRGVAAGIAAGRIPVVLIDERLASIAPLMAALRAHDRPIYSDTLAPALHVVVWIPARRR